MLILIWRTTVLLLFSFRLSYEAPPIENLGSNELHEEFSEAARSNEEDIGPRYLYQSAVQIQSLQSPPNELNTSESFRGSRFKRQTIYKSFRAESTWDSNKAKTTIYYFNSHGKSYKFDIDGLLPVHKDQMIDWIERNSHNYHQTTIPYESYTNINQVSPQNSEPDIIRKRFKSQTTFWGSKTSTTIYYYHSHGASYKFDIDGPLPVHKNEMIDWIEKNSHKYTRTSIPYVPDGQEGQPVAPALPPPPPPPPKPVIPQPPPPPPPPKPVIPQPPPPPPPQKGRPWDGAMPDICGRVGFTVREKVTGGKLSQIEKTPWQVALLRVGTLSLLCGGSVISKRHIITASHCFYKKVQNGETDPVMSKDSVRVVAGASYLQDNIRFFHIQELYLHDGYAPDHKRNDIALIFIFEEFSLNEFIFPICLPPKTAHYRAGKVCLASGYGAIKADQSPDQQLRTVEIPITTAEQCKERNSKHSALTKGMFCAGDYTKGGKDTCGGDSGGPFVCHDGGDYRLYGVTSWGVGCGEKEHPGVYTKVSRYLPWIEDKLEQTK